ncbi:hypothetical protein [Lentzea sp.]|uniref:hypothetical protein n=1 Tax=Lentzea sp. TaxID=56099 RepID=UPI002B892184|nr:hypothetical protein [Lentzea sp.]HUQ61012.1 hypothetical protein [Lentzea sp.]
MTDRRKIAPALLLLAAVSVVVGSFQDTYGLVFQGGGLYQSVFTSLWGVTSGTPEADGQDTAVHYAAGMPVVVCAALLVVAAVLAFRGRGRALALVAAGALAGIVFYYVTQVLHEEELRASWPGGPEAFEFHFYAGTYLLAAGAVIGLAGAVLAQRKQPESDEAVVVHQLGADDDTPPFGIDLRQETR